MAKRPNRVNPLLSVANHATAKPMTGKDKSREERLAEALRENLRKRKSQSRELTQKVEEKPKD